MSTTVASKTLEKRETNNDCNAEKPMKIAMAITNDDRAFLTGFKNFAQFLARTSYFFENSPIIMNSPKRSSDSSSATPKTPSDMISQNS